VQKHQRSLVMLYKIGENLSFTQDNVLEPRNALSDKKIAARFVKLAKKLKRVAPRAKDFLYGHCIMMNAAEASLIDQNTGEPILHNGKPVIASFEPYKLKNGKESVRWKSSDPNLNPYKNCFVPGTMILMEDGTEKNIEDINIGEKVITHTGAIKRVEELFITDYNGDILDIGIRNNAGIQCSPEHPLHKVQPNKEINRPRDLKRVGYKYGFVEAKQITKYDILTTPKVLHNADSQISKDVFYLFGLFAAEGCYAKKYNKRQGLRFTFNIKEFKTLAKNAKELFERNFEHCSVKTTKYESKSVCEMTVTGKGICDLFFRNVGEYSYSKKLSEEIVFGSPDNQLAFIVGWLDGDGHVEKKYGQVIGVTTSADMSSQISVMLNRLNICNSRRKILSTGESTLFYKNSAYTQRDVYRIEIPYSYGKQIVKQTKFLNFSNHGKTKNYYRHDEKYILSTVKCVESRPYSGKLFNLKVEDDNSYVANGISVHNCNGDIFPESELIKAHKQWIGKPLCKDHKSESVDGIRGIVIDTYYDPKFKRVHALFALDKKNYGDLARKVETGYANCVSMGTAVGRSVCTECGNVAVTEREYCKCIHARNNYGEINLDLSPIELSLVVNGADGLARIRNIVASLNGYTQKKQDRLDEMTAARCVNPAELQDMADVLGDMQKKLAALMNLEKTAGEGGELVALLRELKETDDPWAINQLKAAIKQLGLGQDTEEESEDQEEQIDTKKQKMWPPVRPGAGGPTVSPMAGDGDGPGKPSTTTINGFSEGVRYASKEGDKQGAFNELRLLRSKIDKMQLSLNALNKKVSKEDNTMNSARLRARAKARRAYWLGGGGVNEPTPGKPKYEKDPMAEKVRDTEDKQMTGQPLETGSEGLHPGDVEKLRDAGRGGLNLSKAELKDRAMKRRAYYLGGGGVNEPSPGKYPYDKDPMAEKVRNTEDKHLQGIYEMGGKDGTVPGDMEVKKKLLRAKLRAKFTKVADSSGSLRKDASRWDVYAGDKLVLTATGNEIYGKTLTDNWDYLSSRGYGKDVIKYIREEGLDRVAYLLKGAAEPPAADPLAEMPMGAGPGAGEEVMPLETGEAADVPPAPEAATEEEGGVKGKVEAALTKLEESIEDIRAAVTEGGDKLVDIEVKVDPEVGNEAAPSPVEEVTASSSNALEIHALMNDAADELALISEALDEDNVDERVLKAAGQALADSEKIFAYAAIVLEAADKKEDKKDEKKDDEKEDKKDDEKDDEKEDKKDEKKEAGKLPPGLEKFQKGKKDDKKDDKKEDKKDDEKDEKEDDEDEDDKEKKVKSMLDDVLRLRAENRASLLAKTAACGVCQEADCPGDCDVAPADDMLVDLADDLCGDGEDCSDVDDADDFVIESEASVKEARRKAREELVSQAADKILGKYELSLDKAQNATEKTYFAAHPGGKGTVTDLTHTKTDEAKVETISEIHDVMRDVAESGPRNVREAAMALQESIVKGAFTVEDLDRLVAEGKVDAAAASYWKKYWGQGSDTGSFGADLSKEFTSKKKEASDNGYKVKLRRAYDLGLVAQEKSIIGPTRTSLETYVDEVMQFDDAAFESTKRIVAGMNSGRKSGSLPRVGVDAATEAMSVTASAETTSEPNLTSQLGGLGWK